MTIVRLPVKSKYRNKRVGQYDSQAEAKYGAELELLAKAGKISELQVHPRFSLLPGSELAGYPKPLIYEADFAYYAGPPDSWATSPYVVVDVKGYRTEVYKIKKRLMKQLLNIDITEVTVK